MKFIVLLFLFYTSFASAHGYKPGDRFLIIKDIILECNSSTIKNNQIDTLLIWPALYTSNRIVRCERKIPKNSIFEITSISKYKGSFDNWTELNGNLILSNVTTFTPTKKNRDWTFLNNFGNLSSNNLQNIKIQMRYYNLDLNNKDLNVLYYKKVNK